MRQSKADNTHWNMYKPKFKYSKIRKKRIFWVVAVLLKWVYHVTQFIHWKNHVSATVWIWKQLSYLRKQKKHMEYCLSGCSSLKFIGNEFYEGGLKSFELVLDLKYIDWFSYSIFDKFTSLESVIVHEHQFKQTRAFNSFFMWRKYPYQNIYI